MVLNSRKPRVGARAGKGWYRLPACCVRREHICSVSRATLSLPGCVLCLSADTDTVCVPLGKETEALKGLVPARVHTGESSVSKILHFTGHCCWATYKLMYSPKTLVRRSLSSWRNHSFLKMVCSHSGSGVLWISNDSYSKPLVTHCQPQQGGLGLVLAGLGF